MNSTVHLDTGSSFHHIIVSEHEKIFHYLYESPSSYANYIDYYHSKPESEVATWTTRGLMTRDLLLLHNKNPNE